MDSQASSTDLLVTLSTASDLGVGFPTGQGLRACYIGLNIAERLGIPADDLRDVGIAHLLKDAGCTSFTTQLAAFIGGDEIEARREATFERPLSPIDSLRWAARRMGAGEPLLGRLIRLADFAVHGRDFAREGFFSAGEMASRVAARLGASEAVQRSVLCLFEHWNGGGMPFGLKGEEIPIGSRIALLASYVEVANRTGGAADAVAMATAGRAKVFDPQVVDAFESMAARSEFWAGLESDSVAAIIAEVLGKESLPFDIEAFAECCADFVDMKSFWLAGHSRRVAHLAEQASRKLGFSVDAVRDMRILGLIHDLGLVAVPSFIINRPESELLAEEQQRLASHGGLLRVIFSRVPSLGGYSEIAAGHHDAAEQSSQRSQEASLLAVVNRFDELTHPRPGLPAVPPERALSILQSEFDASSQMIEAVGKSIASVGVPEDKQPATPHGLTPRELEILVFTATGLSRRAIAQKLIVSESTVRTHLENIYRKLGVSTKVGAVLFAVEHDLLP